MCVWTWKYTLVLLTGSILILDPIYQLDPLTDRYLVHRRCLNAGRSANLGLASNIVSTWLHKEGSISLATFSPSLLNRPLIQSNARLQVKCRPSGGHVAILACFTSGRLGYVTLQLLHFRPSTNSWQMAASCPSVDKLAACHDLQAAAAPTA
jgi:hypothetical protein